jgi:hypothetical protein
MHPSRPRAPASHRKMRIAILASVIAGGVVLVAGNARKAPRAVQGSSVQEPEVRRANDGVFELFKQKPVVALADFHGLAQEEDFYSDLVRDPRFASQVGNVVVEFGGSISQGIIDRYVNGADVPFTELRRVWTDEVGWLPGPFYLGDMNFFANVRAANLKLPPERRIKVWLGDPKIDWGKTSSFRDIQPALKQRDANIFRIITEEILKKHKKTLLIIGSAHLSWPDLPRYRFVGSLLAEAYPQSLAVISPFVGYVEPECNAKLVARAKDWPVPAVVGPIQGTWLESELKLPGCNYLTRNEVERMKVRASGATTGNRLPPADMIAARIAEISGIKSVAMLYLGPPDTFTESPMDPSIYLDLDYFNELNRRAQCCFLPSYSLNWDGLLQQNSAVPRKFHP